MATKNSDGTRRISVDLPDGLVNRFDELKKEWGLRGRGAVLERLLETLFEEEIKEVDNTYIQEDIKNTEDTSSSRSALINDSIDPNLDHKHDEYMLETSIILINSDIVNAKSTKSNVQNRWTKSNKASTNSKVGKSVGIDLPGFVRSRTESLKSSLNRKKDSDSSYQSIVHGVEEEEVYKCLEIALSHWTSLYGNSPKEEVIEASMIWIARDIWPYLDDTENVPFTWNAASRLMSKFCPSWEKNKPSFESIIVIAGVLEDPFATNSLKNRIPTLIRRFVSSFKRRRNVTSFQTLESTMTVHGALKLLGLPTVAGKSISLKTVRDAYRAKALENHPDSGGSTELMRRINEAYQLLKDLYKA